MTQQLNNFIMLGTDAKGVDYKIVMSDAETALYIDSGYGEYFDDADTVKEMACLRVGVEYVDYNDWDVVTEETV